MAIQYDEDQVPWLEPRHLNLRDLARDIEKSGVDGAIAKYCLSPAEWAEAAHEIAQQYRKGAVSPARDDILNASVNRTLAQHALCFPPYGTVAELHDLDRLLNESPPDFAAVRRLIFSVVMNPRIRALQLVGRFLKLPPFDEFGYLIDAAALSFYRGNIPSAFMTIIPVIEGLLLRWQGYPGTSTKKPTFSETLDFVHNLATQQPIPLLPLFYDSWTVAAETILREHLYRHTNNGPAIDHFNRHLALHLLDDQTFGTQDNVTRGFLLIDILSEIFICERRLKDPRWETTLDEEAPHYQAYMNALQSQAFSENPENILRMVHAKCR